MNVITECRIGSLPWFTGVFWLGLATVAHLLAGLAFRIGLYKIAWAFIKLTMKANKMALKCAIEGGAKVEEDQ